MKNKYIIIGLLLSALIGLQSCTKDFIDLDPKTGQQEANYYNNEEEAFLALTAIYDALSVQNWGNLYLSSECFSDDVFGGGGDYGDQEQLKEIDFGLITLENGSAHAIWNKSYSGIYLEMGSSKRNFPSSHNIITAVDVMALVCEAMRKIASVSIFLPAGLSAMP